MNETMKTILTRRSIRSFQEKPIPEEDVKQLVDAALHAPSGMGKQTWKFTVVMNREKIQKLAKAIGAALGRDGYDMYQPEVLIIPSIKREPLRPGGQRLRPGEHFPGGPLPGDRLRLDQPASGHLRPAGDPGHFKGV